MSLFAQLPSDWQQVLLPLINPQLFSQLEELLAREEKNKPIFPPVGKIFAAFQCTPFQSVKALLLGQDPYHEPGQACGLAFSVPNNVPPPPSLRNILKEYCSDLALPLPSSTSLEPWARQGVLLLNSVLTVRCGEANSHQNQGWETFTDAVINALAKREKPLVFLLWGKSAANKKKGLDCTRHIILESPHPSPLSAYRGFFGSCPFSKTNTELLKKKIAPIDWKLP
ncbi:MAG: uracil-DNA glycosylase [Lentisphaeria bacterium]